MDPDTRISSRPVELQLRWAELAIGLMGLAALVFLLIGEDTEASVFGLSFLGLLLGRMIGIPGRALFVLALAITACLSAILLGVLGGSVAFSAAAHVIVSGLLAWGLAEPVHARLARNGTPNPSQIVFTLVAVVFVLGVCWEAGEQIADRALGTALTLGFLETMADLAADVIGALIGSVMTIRRADR